MTSYLVEHEHDLWLLSTVRQIKAYVVDNLVADPAFGEDVEVEMSFPDTANWTKKTPLDKILVHFEIDDESEPILGFGIPTTIVDNGDGTQTESEAVQHLINFDVGIWVSAEMGGHTKRLEARQALKNLFATATARQNFRDALGIQIVSFEGGSDVLDRINDVPVWRTTQMTLIVRVFSKHTPDEAVVQFDDFDQEQELTIVGPDGEPEHVMTTEEPWT